MEKKWELIRPDMKTVDSLRAALGCHPVLATVLANRGIASPEKATAFLEATLNHLRPPTGLKDLDRAVQRIGLAISRGESILLFGDYDVDGATSTVVLLEFLKACGAKVDYYIPHRVKEGYGFQEQHVSLAVAPSRASLVITVDCGSGSHAAVNAANAAGIDVIITDHHNLAGELPAAVAVVNPKRPDCSSGLSTLAGVGVAFCVVIALRKHLRDLGFWAVRPEPNLKALCDLVALGTLADMVPLIDDNRILARTGLELINSGGRPGLLALAEVSGISNRNVDSEDIAYRLGPRLNAAGRVGHAGLAVELLTADHLEPARKIAQTLNNLNADRQGLEREILADIDRIIARQPQWMDRRTLVLAQPGWHDGVLGVAASKVMDKYCRPVVLIALKEDCGRGSARSISGIDIYESLTACRGYLSDLGGHAQAAGLKIAAGQVPGFREAFEAVVRSRYGPETFIPKVSIDAVLDFNSISGDLADQLETLMPFGAGNPEPIFMAQAVSVAFSAPAGAGHRRLVLTQPSIAGATSLKAIQFNTPHQTSGPLRFESIAFRLRWNRWNGSRTMQLMVLETWPG